jgi:hypothetical protein
MSRSLMESKPRLFAEKREASATRKFKGCATRQWINDNLNDAVNAQLAWEAAGDSPENQEVRTTLNSPEALRFFGLGVHTVADETSPEHEGFQTWHGYGDGKRFQIDVMTTVYIPSVNDIRAGWHLGSEFAAGFYAVADEQEAKYNVYLLWVQYQARLRSARKNRLKKAKSATGCSSKKAKVAGDPCTPKSTK